MCRPITKALFKCDPELAVRTYLDAESFYHPIARLQLRKVGQRPMQEAW
jgi:leukotriene-A4 hydrolase